jgi:hypothetical protein
MVGAGLLYRRSKRLFPNASLIKIELAESFGSDPERYDRR